MEKRTEYLRRNWGPAGAGKHGRIKQQGRAELPAQPPNIMGLVRAVDQEDKEWPIKEAYAGLMDSFGLTRPTLEQPIAYFLVKNNGHLNFMESYKPRYEFSDPKLVEWLLAEHDVKEVFCKGCRTILPLIMKLEHVEGTLRLIASADCYCTNKSCLAITHFKKGAFRHGRIYRSIFK